jgi:spore coat polysaccharide biosynthesis protein SpsF
MIIVMQGRLRSTRLPGKGFFTFFGKTIWERMCDIAMSVDGVDDVIFATGDDPDNQLMRPLVESRGAKFFSGSETNVLQRYCRAIEHFKGEYLIRLTCDNYLAQPRIITALYREAKKKACDYAYIEPLTHYAGEVVKCSALRQCHAGSYSDQAREHVTWDIRNNPHADLCVLPAGFMGINHQMPITLDTIDDLVLLKTLESRYPELEAVSCMDGLSLAQNNISAQHAALA